ncbi:MAG: T9SS type A sorting domain-containing protein [Bacteroidia bacterium]
MKKTLLFTTLMIATMSGMAQQNKFSNPLGGRKMLETAKTQCRSEATASLASRAAFNNQFQPDSAFYFLWDAFSQMYSPDGTAKFHYNSNQQLTGMQRFNSFGFAELVDTLLYDNNGRLIEQLTTYMGVPEMRIVVDYNAAGQIISRKLLQAISPSDWEIFIADSLALTDYQQGRPTSYTLYMHIPFSGSGWEPLFRASMINYNTQGMPTSQVLQEFDGLMWGDSLFKTDMHWGFGFTNWSDALGLINPIEAMHELLPKMDFHLMIPTAYTLYYRGISGQLEALERVVPDLHGPSVNQIEMESFFSNQWHKENRVRFIRDTMQSQHIGSIITDTWGGMIYEPMHRTHFTYNPTFAPFILGESSDYWDSDSSIWVSFEATAYDYSPRFGRPDSFAVATFDPMTGQFEAESLILYSYTTAASLGQVKINELKVWPNPAQNQLMVSLSDQSDHSSARIKVFDMHGRLMLEDQAIAPQHQLQIDLLSQGIYLLQVEQAGRLSGTRFIKQ